MKLSRRVLSSVLIALVASRQASATLLTVTSLNDSGPGTLRDQVAAAAPGDTIQFSVTGLISLNYPAISIAKDLTISGPGAGTLSIGGTAESGGVTTSLFSIASGSVAISGLTLTESTGSDISQVIQDPNTGMPKTIYNQYGGAIYMTGGSLTLANSVLSKNIAEYGGAVYMNGGSMTITGCTLSYNGLGAGDIGGAIWKGEGVMSIINCTLSNNLAGFGGAIYSAGSLNIMGSTLSGNIAKTDYSDNLNGRGGAIDADGGVLNVTNCTISGNRAEGIGGTLGVMGGGGIFAGGSLNLANSTITNNLGKYGGGILKKSGLNLSNSIVAGNGSSTIDPNSGPDIYGISSSAGSNNTTASGSYNLVQYSDYLLYSGTNNILGQAALLSPLGNYGGPTQTHRLLPASPALDAGDPNFDATNLPYDQRGPGYPRIRNGRLCIGAYESEVPQSGSSFVVNTLDDHDDGIAGPTDCTLREAVNYAPAGATITFSVAGVITLTQGELVVSRNLTIQGPATGPGITVSGNNQSRIFTITGGPSSISNLTLTGGNGLSAVTDDQNPSGAGGALYVYTKNPATVAAVSNCTFTGNTSTPPTTGTAGGGGAIRSGGTLSLINSTFTNNTAPTTGGGGAIRSGGTLTIIGCTITGNTCTGSLGGGGIYNANIMSLSNSIVTGNTATTGPDVVSAIASGKFSGGDYNLIGSSIGSNYSGTHNIFGQAALLGPLANNGGSTQTFKLLPGSPAIDAGSSALIPSGVTTDQRGSARIQGNAVDLGAFELDTTPPSIAISAPSSATSDGSSTVSYTVTYSDASFSISTLSSTDVTLNHNGTANATVSVDSGSGATRTVTLSGITGSGTLGISIASGTAIDLSGNLAPAAGPSATFAISAPPPNDGMVHNSGTIQAVTGSSGSYAIGFSGTPGQQYIIQYSSNLQTWQTLTTQASDSSGAISITDTPPAGEPMRFYRFILP